MTFTNYRKICRESKVWSTSEQEDLILGLSKAIDQLAMENIVCRYGHVLRREDGHVLRVTLDIEVGGQRKKGRLKRTCEE